MSLEKLLQAFKEKSALRREGNRVRQGLEQISIFAASHSNWREFPEEGIQQGVLAVLERYGVWKAFPEKLRASGIIFPNGFLPFGRENIAKKNRCRWCG